MNLGFGGNLLKSLVFFFNAIVFIGGGVIGGFGIYFLLEAQKTGGAVPIMFPAFITTFGLLLFLLGFLGCYGACTQNITMLRSFVDIVGEEFRKSVNQFQLQPGYDDPAVKYLIKIQKELKCCGGVGPNDWTIPPPSCCGQESGLCAIPYFTGCAEAMYEKVKDSILIFGISVAGICAIQIGAIICAACLAKRVTEFYEA